MRRRCLDGTTTVVRFSLGPDGYLYIGMGDGGGAGDPPNLAQNLGSPLGKMLRVDIDGDAPAVAPASNPFHRE